MNRLRFLAAVCCALTLTAFAAEPPVLKRPDTGNLKYAEVVKAAESFDEVLVWEGLPHPFEKPAFERELAAKKTFRIGEQLFYTDVLALKPEEKTAASDAVLKHRENFKAWNGAKLCGGFHADYAVEWRAAGKTLAQALICFSCDEAEFRVGDRTERVNLGNSALRTLLTPFRAQRPMPVPAAATPTK